MRRIGVALSAAFWCLGMARAGLAASIDMGVAAGHPGEGVTIAVSLRTMGASVLGTQNRIDFTPEVRIAADASGEPDCAVNPAIDKNATGFRFLPLGCAASDTCQSVRVFVLAFDNLDPIADGSTLYTCRVSIAADAPEGRYPLTNAEVASSAAGGVSVPTTGTDGAVVVSRTAAAAVNIGPAAGPPGATVTVAVTLALLGEPPAEVAGVANDIGFDPTAPIAARENGAPDCDVDEVIDKNSTTFSFLPLGCIPGDDCTGVRALVLSVDNTIPIPNGSTLYTCRIAIDADAQPGTYVLNVIMPRASGPLGEELLVTANDGMVEVTEAPVPPCVGDCNGDRTVAINELLVGVNVVIGTQPVSACLALDSNADEMVAINELILGVNNALGGCPPAP